MKKKLIILLLSIFIIAGCSCSKKEELKEENKTNENTNIVNIDNKSIELNKEDNHYNLYYKYNEKEFKSELLEQYKYLEYTSSNKEIVTIKLMYYKNKSINNIMDGTGYELKDKKIGNTDYKYFEFYEEEILTHSYVYNYNNDTYTINFASNTDMNSLEEIFMKNVYFKSN